jgi:hypothetical protein
VNIAPPRVCPITFTLMKEAAEQDAYLRVRNVR